MLEYHSDIRWLASAESRLPFELQKSEGCTSLVEKFIVFCSMLCKRVSFQSRRIYSQVLKLTNVKYWKVNHVLNQIIHNSSSSWVHFLLTYFKLELVQVCWILTERQKENQKRCRKTSEWMFWENLLHFISRLNYLFNFEKTKSFIQSVSFTVEIWNYCSSFVLPATVTTSVEILMSNCITQFNNKLLTNFALNIDVKLSDCRGKLQIKTFCCAI